MYFLGSLKRGLFVPHFSYFSISTKLWAWIEKCRLVSEPMSGTQWILNQRTDFFWRRIPVGNSAKVLASKSIQFHVFVWFLWNFGFFHIWGHISSFQYTFAPKSSFIEEYRWWWISISTSTEISTNPPTVYIYINFYSKSGHTKRVNC